MPLPGPARGPVYLYLANYLAPQGEILQNVEGVEYKCECSINLCILWPLWRLLSSVKGFVISQGKQGEESSKVLARSFRMVLFQDQLLLTTPTAPLLLHFQAKVYSCHLGPLV